MPGLVKERHLALVEGLRFSTWATALTRRSSRLIGVALSSESFRTSGKSCTPARTLPVLVEITLLACNSFTQFAPALATARPAGLVLMLLVRVKALPDGTLTATVEAYLREDQRSGAASGRVRR
jgi:hypothetical protein